MMMNLETFKKRKLDMALEATEQFKNDIQHVSFDDLKPEENDSRVAVTHRYSMLVTVKLPTEAHTYLKTLRQKFRHHGVYIDLVSWERESPMPSDRLQCLLTANPYHALVCTSFDKIDTQTCTNYSTIKVISTMSVGTNHIDMDAFTKDKIRIAHTPGVLTNTTAELVVALLLGSSRRLIEAHSAVLNGAWEQEPLWMCGKDVYGSTVGFVGFGRIAQAVAKRLIPFGCKIIFSSRSPKPEAAQELGIQQVSFEQVLTESDFVIPLCPLTEETRGLFNENTFAQMKQGSVFINASRGEICVTNDLVKAIQSNHLAAAGLDVTDPEPLPADHPLLTFPNILVLPHIGSATYQTRIRMAKMSIDNAFHGLFEGVSDLPNPIREMLKPGHYANNIIHDDIESPDSSA